MLRSGSRNRLEPHVVHSLLAADAHTSMMMAALSAALVSHTSGYPPAAFVSHTSGYPPAPPPTALAFDCSFRQLAYSYADNILAGRGLDRVAAALDLSDDNVSDAAAERLLHEPLEWLGAASTYTECAGRQSIQAGTCNGPGEPCQQGSGNHNAWKTPTLQMDRLGQMDT